VQRDPAEDHKSWLPMPCLQPNDPVTCNQLQLYRNYILGENAVSGAGLEGISCGMSNSICHIENRYLSTSI
jgi:hypothetical protein